ncbi:hypothetical protein [Haloparvum sp. AD34]
MAYFVIAATMWGGGVISWSDSGLGKIIIENPETGEVNEETASELEGLGGPIQQVATTVGGGAVLAVWNVLVKFVSYLFWPITVLEAVGAPASAVVLFGGSMSLGFILGLVKLIRGAT